MKGIKKKALITVSSFLAIIILALLLAPINFYEKSTVHVISQIEEVSPQISNLRNWINWFPDLQKLDSSSFRYSAETNKANSYLQTDDFSLKIIKVTPTEAVVEETDHGRTSYHSVFALADSFGMATNITWTKSVRPFHWLREKISSTNESEKVLDGLKTFMETPVHFYGFAITVRKVVDTLVITKKILTTKDKKISELKKMYAELYEFARVNNINASKLRMAAFKDDVGENIEIMAGVPVDKRMPTTNGINYLNMPPNGNTLVAEFKGPYTDIHKLYEALGKYIIDRNKKRVALPYEKYLTDPKTHEDSLDMKIELFSPVY